MNILLNVMLTVLAILATFYIILTAIQYRTLLIRVETLETLLGRLETYADDIDEEVTQLFEWKNASELCYNITCEHSTDGVCPHVRKATCP